MPNEWFFSDPEAVVRLRASAKSWEGTPFSRGGRVKGRHGGIYCTAFVEEVYYESDYPARFEFPVAEADFHPVARNTKILNYLRGLDPDPQSVQLAKIFAEFPVAEKDFTEPPMAGDLLLMRNDTKRARDCGEFLWHMPVLVSEHRFYSSISYLGVAEGTIQDSTYRRHLYAHFRARLLPNE